MIKKIIFYISITLLLITNILLDTNINNYIKILNECFNKKENRVGIVFRNRYVSEPIYNERYLAKCINYIHMNPVKAGMVNEYERKVNKV